MTCQDDCGIRTVPDPFFSLPNDKEKKRSGHARLSDTPLLNVRVILLVRSILLVRVILHERTCKFILSDYTSDYRTRLIQLGMLPLMYIYEISDILFFIKSLKTPTDKFNILNYVSFNTGSTRSSGIKLHHKTTHTNAAMNYFFRLPRLWNSLPIIDHTQSLTVIKQKLKKILWNHFLANFDNS